MSIIDLRLVEPEYVAYFIKIKGVEQLPSISYEKAKGCLRVFKVSVLGFLKGYG